MSDIAIRDKGDLAQRQPASMLEVVMQAVRDPQVDPARLEHFLRIGRELQQDQARAEFNAAFAALQIELPVIDKKGVVLNKSGAVQFKYARYDDLHDAITPLLAKHGFAASFDFEEPEPGRLRVTLKLMHCGGHAEPYHWTLPAAGQNNYVSNLHNAAAARSFGKRCVLIDALNILTRDQDSDGAPQKAPEVITQEQADKIRDIVDACAEKDDKMKAAFAKWIKQQFGADSSAQLFQGEQYDSVMAMLRDKMKRLGIE